MSKSESEHDDFLDSQDLPTLSPPLLMRSFLTIASSSVACLMLYAGIGMALAAMFFPDVWKALTGQPIEDEAAIPVAMLIPWLAVHGLCCVGIGWLTAKVAPFAAYQHGMILGIFLFIGWAQKVISGDPDKIRLNVLFAIMVPLTIVYGARLFSDRHTIDVVDSDKVA